MTLHTTFALLRKHGACAHGYEELAKSLGGVTKYGNDTPILFVQILDSNGVDDCLWALRATPADQTSARDRTARLIACDFAEQLLSSWQKERPNDTRVADCIAVARRYAEGNASEEERIAAWRAASNAAWDTEEEAACDAAEAAVGAVARDAVWSVMWAAEPREVRATRAEIVRLHLGATS